MNFVCLFAMAFAHAAHVHISQVRQTILMITNFDYQVSRL